MKEHMHASNMTEQVHTGMYIQMRKECNYKCRQQGQSKG